VGTEQQEEIPVPKHSSVNFIPKAIIPAIALASLTCAALLAAAETAAAKAMTCSQKHAACDDRCIKANPGSLEDSVGCRRRTCNHQLRKCMENSVGGGDRPGAGSGTGDGKTGPIVRPKQPPRRPPRDGSANLSTPASNPLGTGILESGPAVGSQGPAATGSPVSAPAAPSAPPVIIR
jgi:hypothetical protein